MKDLSEKKKKNNQNIPYSMLPSSAFISDGNNRIFSAPEDYQRIIKMDDVSQQTLHQQLPLKDLHSRETASSGERIWGFLN